MIRYKGVSAVLIDLHLDIVLGVGKKVVEFVNVKDGPEDAEVDDEIGVGDREVFRAGERDCQCGWFDGAGEVGRVGTLVSRCLKLARFG